ncbi:hypothetical protein AVEN_150719-1 [Araneus ventricosus]|uniref:Homeobox domain-containing protein n=1 Tax=Araneus ventricosus TaxID=182803 RepID=A0A4Y2TL53_ARAVE|nr:hypothetical protein AVEN_150719-1 [Araneus ventricosus]
MPPKDKRSKRARNAAELAKQYEVSETFPNRADLLNEIQQLQIEELEEKKTEIKCTIQISWNKKKSTGGCLWETAAGRTAWALHLPQL